MARYQIERAHIANGGDGYWTMLCAISNDPNLRKKSRDRVRSTENMIRGAYKLIFENCSKPLTKLNKSVEAMMKSVNNYSGFAIGSLALCGALNSIKGSRYFTLKNKLLSTIIAAELDPGDSDSDSSRESMTLDEFMKEVLYERHGFIVDLNLTRDDQEVLKIDVWRFENNKSALEKRLVDTGNARKYSDSTTIVEGFTTSRD